MLNNNYKHNIPQSSKNIGNLRDKDKEHKEQIRKQIRKELWKGR